MTSKPPPDNCLGATSPPETGLLTILLPVRNEVMNLKVMLRVIRTVLEHPHELLVIHDTLDDRSVPVVKAAQAGYPGLRLVHNQVGPGVLSAIRSGVAAARGEVIGILVADDTG